MRGEDARFVRHTKFIEHLDGVAHRFPIRFTPHHHGNEGRRFLRGHFVKTPNSNIQAPEKLQLFKLQTQERVEYWRLKFLWMLERGLWCFRCRYLPRESSNRIHRPYRLHG